jgi:uncharacterized protein YukE
MQTTEQALHEIGFVVESTANNITNKTSSYGAWQIKGSAFGVVKFFEKCQAQSVDLKASAEKVQTYVTTRKEWNGESTKQLLGWFKNGDKDMTAYKKALEELKKNGFVSKIKKQVEGMIVERERCLSEYDGDYDHDRRFDPECYQGTKRAEGVGRTIKLLINFSLASSHSAQQIETYGAQVWAVTQVLEECGFLVDVTVGLRTEGLYYSVDSNRDAFQGLFKVKKADEYINPKILAATLSTPFFRRAVFSIMHAVGNVANASAVSNGLGVCTSMTNGAPCVYQKGGTVILDPACVTNAANVADVVTQAAKAVLEGEQA